MEKITNQNNIDRNNKQTQGVDAPIKEQEKERHKYTKRSITVAPAEYTGKEEPCFEEKPDYKELHEKLILELAVKSDQVQELTVKLAESQLDVAHCLEKIRKFEEAIERLRKGLR